MKRTATTFLFVSAMAWALALFIWIQSGFGLAPMVEFHIAESIAGAFFGASPLWISGLTFKSKSIGAKVVRVCCLLALAAIFAYLGRWMLETVIFNPFEPSKGAFIFTVNLLIFRLPFILAFLALPLLFIVVCRDIRFWHADQLPSVSGTRIDRVSS